MEEQRQARLIQAVARVAEEWREPDYEAREAAVEKTLGHESTYTEESLAFAINQVMHHLTVENLTAWLRGRRAKESRRVGVLNAAPSLFLDVQDLLAVIMTGHQYYGVLAADAVHVLPAFVAELQAHVENLLATFDEPDEVFEASEAVIATVSEETRGVIEEQCIQRGITGDRQLLRPRRYGVAVLDGRESKDDLEKLAEDMLLFDGYDARSVALVWAPVATSPDSLLDSLAEFRGVFPAHPSLSGALKMQQAFLDALKIPNAYGEGMEFLLSKADPVVQRPGHTRWVEYDDISVVTTWLQQHWANIELVVARTAVLHQLAGDLPLSGLGEAHRPPLTWHQAGVDTVAFLERL